MRITRLQVRELGRRHAVVRLVPVAELDARHRDPGEFRLDREHGLGLGLAHHLLVAEQALQALVDDKRIRIVVNCSGLNYISSAGLRSILALAKKLKGNEGKILLAGVSGPVEEVFKISGFSSMFKIFDSEESALRES